MKTRLYRDEEIEKTLSSLDHLQKAEAPPFFYTRLQARLDKQERIKQPVWMLITKPAISFAAVALLLVLNVAMIVHYVRSVKTTTQQSSSGIQQFAEAYNLSGSVLTDKTADQ